MLDDSMEWLEAVDRGDLKHVANMTYMTFISAEMQLRQYIATHQRSIGNLDLVNAKGDLMEDEDVQFHWSMVLANWAEETGEVLLDMMIDKYIMIRGHSTASAWLETYKKEKKKICPKV